MKEEQGLLFEAKEERDRILARHTERSPAFNEIAPLAVLEYLHKHISPACCEDIVDYLKKQGIKPERSMDDRAYGPVFMSLSRRKQIIRVGFKPRRKGHAAPGASIWRLP